MAHIMLDLETKGTRPGCAILSIGAVVMSERGLGSEFYRAVDCSPHPELHEDPETMEWWAKQSDDARKVFTDPEQVSLRNGLMAFDAFLKHSGNNRATFIWGCGSNFDNPIICACYHALKMSAPWPFWNDRCYRTVKAMFKDVEVDRSGTYHNALDDAKTQAEHLIRIDSVLRSTSGRTVFQ